MTLFRAEYRLPEDETILLITDPKDFKYFRERKKLGIRGIAYDLTCNDSVKKSLMKCASAMIAQNSTLKTPKEHLYIEFDSGKEKWQRDQLKQEFNKYDVSGQKHQDVYEYISLLISFREKAIESCEIDGAFRVNNTNHQEIGKHAPALAHSVNKAGVEIVNLYGNIVRIPENIVIIFDETVAHKAPTILPKTLKKSPRLNFTL